MRRLIPALVALIGVALVAIGVWFSTSSRPASFGWTAYSPLTDAAYPITVGPPGWAIVLIVVGSLAVGSGATLLLVPGRLRMR